MAGKGNKLLCCEVNSINIKQTSLMNVIETS